VSLRPTRSRLPVLPIRQTIYILCSTIVLQIVVVVLCFRWFGAADEAKQVDGMRLMALTLFPASAGIAWIWLHAVWGERQGWRGLGIITPPSKWLSYAVFAGVIAVILNSSIVHLFQPILGSPSPLPIGGSGGLTDQPVYVIFAFFVGASILAPLLEEIIFRAILFARLRQQFTFLPAAAISAVSHAIMHGDVATMPGLTVVFIIFAYLYERTGCLWLPIIAHGVHNLLVLVAAFMALS